MKKNKLILFDWGGVVEPQEEGFIKAYKGLFKSFGYDKENVIDSVRKYRLSSIKTIEGYKKVFNKIIKDFGINVSFEEYIESYYKIFMKIKHYKDVANYEISLKDKCYIGILSNLAVIDYERIDKQLGLSNYDYLFLSYELECQKPDKKIYEKVQDSVPFKPSDILFIDDLEKNINTAKKMGWNVCQASGLELDKIKQACEEFLKEESI